MKVHSVRDMDIDRKRPVGAKKPTVSALLNQSLRDLKPDNRIDEEARLWFEELEAKERMQEQEMLEEIHKSYFQSGGRIC